MPPISGPGVDEDGKVPLFTPCLPTRDEEYTNEDDRFTSSDLGSNFQDRAAFSNDIVFELQKSGLSVM